MTDQKPDSGEPTPSTDAAATPDQPDAPAPGEPEVTGEPGEAAASDTDAPEQDAEVGPGDDQDVDLDAQPDAAATDAETDAEAVVAETEAEAADAAAAGAAWTTTPVAPDPEATEAALAALAAKPEVTLEPPPPLSGDGGEPPEEGTPVLLVGGILVGAFIVALAIVLILFRPFDSPTEPDVSLPPTPVVTEAPSASPSATITVDTPNFQGLTLADAEATAEDYGLVVRVNQVQTDQYEPDTVIGQDPAPGEAVDEGSTIELSVAAPMPTNPVPDVIGLSLDDAIDAIEDAGFEVGDITEQYSSDIAAGDVISTDPEVDTELTPGSRIDLVVSIGPQLVAVPDLVDLPEADALDALEAAGLVPGDVSEAYSDSIVAGHVISSDPAADAELAPGAAVAYVRSLGPQLVAVPDLVDLPEADALDALEAAGLVPGDVSEAYSDSIVAGHVISSDPAADAELAPGAAVAYVRSLGPQLVAVPDLVDLPEADALDALEAAGLVPGDVSEAYSDSIVAGHVISSDPAADAELAPGAAVAYVRSLGPQLVAVPDLVDLPEADALDALEAAGLVPGDVSEAYSDSIVAGHVISSDPAADAELAPGAAVAYVRSLGPQLVAVPDLVDLPEADALDALEAAGLVPGDVSEAYSDSIVAGHVISSDPAADAELAPGAAVAYVRSLGPQLVAVPDLVDLPEADALDALEAAGLVPGDVSEAYSDSIVAGHVISSDPAADAELAPGAAVAYVRSLGPQLVAVPDLVDLPEADALDALEAAGLVPGDVSEAYSDSIVAGHVISSDPAADAELAPGAAVAYVRSLGPQLVAVPDLVDLPEADALDALEAAGLVPGDVSEAYSDSIVAGHVISSDPAADAELAPGAAVAYVRSLGPQLVAVPDLVDLPEADALDALEAAGLVPGDVSEAYSDSIVAGHVISSDPAADAELAPGAAVAYVRSLGPQLVAVPDLVDLPEADALDALEAAGLVPGDVSEAYSDSIVAGHVISSDPAADAELAPGAAVAYVRSLGPQLVAVPDLVDLPEADALDALEAAGLVPGDVSEAYSDSIVAGHVISSDPAADAELAPGAAVAYVRSLGPQLVAVPDLVDLPEADALDALEAAGLVPGDVSEAYSDSIVAGHVISSDPAADAELAPGAAVAYVRSLGPQLVAVPDLVDLPEADALDALEAAGLVPGDVSEAYSDSIVAGHVISSDPAADAELAPGAAVAYVRSLGPQLVAVPDLVDLPEADALDALEAAGLVPGDVSEAYSDSIVAGHVISSDPAADAELAPGAAVAYVRSLGPQLVAVPDLVDLPEADALDALEAAGLVPGDVSEAYSDSIVAGHVISSDPAADAELAPGAAVAYVRSLGPQLVAVPDLVDLPEADALDALEAAGLVPGDVSEAYSDSIVAGHVISSDPAADAELAPGAAVAYVRSLGPQLVAVPDLVDLPEADALDALEAAGLVPGDVSEAYSDSIVAGHVISSDPAADAELAPGAAVAYVRSLGPQLVAVPDLVDLPEADALDALEAAGLVPGDVSEAYSDSIVAGHVISSDPAADAELAPGAAVAYVRSLGPQLVAVPDLVDLPEADALDALEAAGLVPGDVSEAYSDSIVAGHVISSDPAADAELAPGAAVAYVRSLGPQLVAVPDLVDLPEADALDALEAAGLVPGDVSEAYSDSIVAGHVISSDPAADAELAPGAAVAYVRSLGPQLVAVPDLVDLPEADALDALEAAGLVPGDVSEAYSDSIVAGHVISSDPAAGALVVVGTTVDYVVSLGVETVVVPDLSGPAAGAEQTLAAAGLVVGDVTEAFSDSVAAGDVISQDPAADAEVELGTAVDYVVSAGVEQVRVPDVRELSEADATAAIEAAGLVVGSVDRRTNASIPEGSAIRSEPDAGSTVDKGSAVLLVISRGPRQVAVPDLVDLPASEAVAALESAELTAGSAGQAYSDSIVAGHVISSDPAAGALVVVGTTVDYVVSLGVETVVVPDLSGPAAGAEQTLAAAGLVVGDVTEAFSDSVAAGDVISQDPAADAEVELGTAVDYVVSAGVEQVRVPDVRELSEADATAAIEAAGLVVGSVDRRTNASIPEGSAIRSEPDAGSTVDKGSAVLLVISRGPRQVAVPDLVDLPASEAVAALESAELTAGSAGQAYSDSIVAGHVISSDPAAGALVVVGTTVDYVVSLGVETVVVPDLSGPAAGAEQTLAAAGLVPGDVSEAFSDSVAAGDVISQDPAADAEVELGTAVDYVVSAGVEQVRVPDVRELSEADATAAIEAAGLVVGSVDRRTNASIPEGSAIRSEPDAGSTVDKGSAVLLVISRGPRQVAVPDLVDLPASEAVAALESAELTAGSAGQAYSDSIVAGHVISSDPAAGALVVVGTTVDYVVSLGVETVVVPDLSGPAAGAEQTLAAAGLVVGDVTEAFSDSVAAGDVISQDPAADAEVELGTAVDYVVSAGIPPDVEVPEVRDLPQGDAISTIEAAGLLVGEIVEQSHQKVAAGSAIKTAPAAGSSLPMESSVRLFVSTGSSIRTVPDVNDQPAAEAQAALEGEGLVVDVQERTNAKVAAGNAVKTDPAAGADVEVGSTVVLTISKGPKQVVVPDVVGLTKAEAVAAIAGAELTPGEESVVEDPAPRNTVLDQRPAAGTEADKGSAVDFTVSAGPPTIEVPPVRGLSEADAGAAIEAAGLGVGVVEQRTNATIPAGNAVKTEPASGELVVPGTDITLFVSKGPKPVVVPDTVGSTRAQAAAVISDAGLQVGEETVIEDAAPRNTVLMQDPAAGVEVAPGSAVDLTLSSGPPDVSVPDVKDQPAAEAQAALEGEGLVVDVQERTNARVAAGNAVKTEPPAGAEVEVGSSVTLIVSKGPKQIEVPDVRGLDEAAAKAAIKAAQLKPGDTATAENDAPAGSVVGQEPAPGAVVGQGSVVNLTVSAGAALSVIPEVKGLPAADAQAALEAQGLAVDVQDRTNAKVPAGDAVKTQPKAGAEVQAGSTVTLTVSKGPKQVQVPDLVGLSEADAMAALAAAELQPGERAEVNHEDAPAGSVLSQDPAAGTALDKGSSVAFTVSLGPVVEPRGEGGSLDAPEVAAQLDAVAAAVPPIRELALGSTPYDAAGNGEQAEHLRARADVLYDPATIVQAEQALKRMGLLSEGDDLAALLDQLYGQPLPIAYLEERGRQSIAVPSNKLDVAQRTEAAREFGQAAAYQQFGSDAARTGDPSDGDEALAAIALTEGDGTATMLQWVAENLSSGNQSKADAVIVPGDDGILASMPPLLQREYSFPYLEGRLFVDRLRANGGWEAVDSAWSRLPETTEQILHPQLYPDERPTTLGMDGLGGTLGRGWSVQWQQTMGELRTGVWLADGQAGTQAGPRAPIKLPKANAAAGWGGDRLVSLDGPDGAWAIVWQTKWDTADDVAQFVNAANSAIADLPGAHAVLEADVSSGASNPVLVLLTSDEAALASVAESLGLGDAVASP